MVPVWCAALRKGEKIDIFEYSKNKKRKMTRVAYTDRFPTGDDLSLPGKKP